MNMTQVRRFAMSLPGVTEEPHHHFGSFRVTGRIFVTVPPEQTHLHLFVPEAVREQALAAWPAVAEKLLWGGKVVGMRVVLNGADAALVKGWIREAWQHKMPAAKGVDQTPAPPGPPDIETAPAARVAAEAPARGPAALPGTTPGAPANSVHPLTRAEWRAWLQAHASRPEGVWFVGWKQHTGQPRLSYDDQVEEALCFGWVDSKVNKLDADRSLLWFAPRQPRTGWSRPNKRRIERLLAAGLMMPAALAKVEAAKADGSWTSLDAVEDLVVPPDLAAALAALPGAEQHFAAFPRSARRGILEWIHTARRPQTRAARVQETARKAAANQRANQWTPKTG
ncbi:MAG: YdeI/OmpD-associated family protein [Rubrivivax sp.]|nr:YdeI/OmpD-associated family protein [Rubrivivax sp.]